MGEIESRSRRAGLPTPSQLSTQFRIQNRSDRLKTKERYPASIPGRAPCFVDGMISSHASVVGRVIYCVFESAYPRGTIPELVRRSTQLPRMSCLDHVLTQVPLRRQSPYGYQSGHRNHSFGPCLPVSADPKRASTGLNHANV
jgi:hypothetical protein